MFGGGKGGGKGGKGGNVERKHKRFAGFSTPPILDQSTAGLQVGRLQ
jgi:hypothetical protein